MRQWILTDAALALAACGGDKGGGNALADGNAAGNAAGNTTAGNTAAGTAPGAGANVQLRPGQWQMTAQLVRIEAPNMPAGVNRQMPPQTTSRCLTAEEAARANAGTWAQNTQASGCTGDSGAMAGGRIQGRMQCDTPQGRATITTNGRYTAETLEIGQQFETAAGGQTMTMEWRVTGRRIGDCTG